MKVSLNDDLKFSDSDLSQIIYLLKEIRSHHHRLYDREADADLGELLQDSLLWIEGELRTRVFAHPEKAEIES